jgi:calcium-activated chloride channel regulator 4
MKSLYQQSSFYRIVFWLMLGMFFLPTAQAQKGNASTNVVFKQTFDATSTPTGWRVVNNVGTAGWRFDDPAEKGNLTGGQAHFAIADSDHAGEVDMDTELRLPLQDFSSATSVKLQFKTAFQALEGGKGIADIDVSVDGGTQWINVWRETATFAGTVTKDLSAQVAKKPNVMVRFRYYNANWEFEWQIDDVQLEAASATVAPDNLTATADKNTINLSWKDNSNNEDQFVIERSLSKSGEWTPVTKTRANVTSYADSKLGCNTTYFYRVNASNTTGHSGYSNIANATTAACSALSSLNENFDAGVLPTGWQVIPTKSWTFNDSTDIADNNNTFFGQVKADMGIALTTELRTPIINLTDRQSVKLMFSHYLYAWEGTVYVDVTANGGKTWTNVLHFNDNVGYMPFDQQTIDLSKQAAGQSNVMLRFRADKMEGVWRIDDVQLKTFAKPTAPTTLSAVLGANSAVNLSWQGNSTAQFEVERSLDASHWQQISTTKKGVTSHIDKTVSGQTTYHYRVRSSNSAGISDYSQSVSIKTQDRATIAYDVTISYYDTAANTASKKTALENIIGFFADAVYEMSNGAHQIGQVTIYTDSAYKDKADVVWVKDCRPMAAVSGYGHAGQQFTMCDTSGPENYLQNATMQAVGGYGALGHEWGHYFYSVYDEYPDSDTECDVYSPEMPCKDDKMVKNSIMSQGDNAAPPEGDLNWLNFSTAVNNNTSTNVQYRMYGASAWETLARPLSKDPRQGVIVNETDRLYHPELQAVAPKPGQMPSIELAGSGVPSQVARKKLKIVWKGGNTTSTRKPDESGEHASVLQLVIDRSNSVSSERLEELKTSVQQWLKEVNVGDFIGVISFDNTPTVVHPLTRIDGEATKEAISNAIMAMTQSSNPPALGDALQLALDGLMNAGSEIESLVWSVYLFANGESVAGTPPLAIIPRFQETYVPIYAFGLNADETTEVSLQQLADETAGEYRFTATQKELLTALESADQASSPTVDVNLKVGWDLVTNTKEFPFYVDSSIGQLGITLSYSGDLSSATLTVVDPNGNTHSVTEADCEVFEGEFDKQTYCETAIANSVEGTWTLQVVAHIPELDLLYWVNGTPKDNGATFFAFVESLNGEVLEYPQPLLLSANVIKDTPITGITVTGTLQTPAGYVEEFTMRDDGVAPDAKANDGYYAALLDYAIDGYYYITIEFDNTANTGQSTDLGMVHAPAQNSNTPKRGLRPVGEKFERVAEIQINVTGAPAASYDESGEFISDEWVLTPLEPNNIGVAGKIDHAEDFDTYVVTVPADYNPETEKFSLQIYNLGLDMDPYLHFIAEDESWFHDAYFDVEPTSNDVLSIPLSVKPGETFYVEVSHLSTEATAGLYEISAGRESFSPQIRQGTTPPEEAPPVLPPPPTTGQISAFYNYQGQTLTDATIEENSSLSNATLVGTITNQGWLSNITVSSEATLQGGTLTGNVTNKGTVKDITFVGHQLQGGELEGKIIINSDTDLGLGVVKNVTLAKETYLQYGVFDGTVTGKAEGNALIEDAKIRAGAKLSHVTLGEGCQVAEGVGIGVGVRFADDDLIPEETDLTQALSTEGVINLNTDVVTNAPSLLAQINELPDMQQNGWQLFQSDTGQVEVMVNGTRLVVIAKHVKQSNRKRAQLIRHGGGSVTAITANGREIQVQVKTPE